MRGRCGDESARDGGYRKVASGPALVALEVVQIGAYAALRSLPRKSRPGAWRYARFERQAPVEANLSAKPDGQSHRDRRLAPAFAVRREASVRPRGRPAAAKRNSMRSNLSLRTETRVAITTAATARRDTLTSCGDT